MPLRPLGLGDIYDAAFRIIRFNPKATVGSAVLVASVAMALPLLVTAAFTWSVDLSLDQSGNDLATADLAGLIGSISALGIGAVLQGIGTILVTGMIAHVTAAAAIGRRLSLGEAWRATHGKRWRLIGTSFLLALGAIALVAGYVGAWFAVAAAADGATPVVIWGLLSVPVFICLLVWLWIRVSYLPVPALMLEEVGVFGALGRGFRLSRRQFWRIFGIALLTLVITGVASQVLATPLGLIGQVAISALGPQYELLGLVVVQAVTSVLTAAFVSPFSGAVTSLQYLDQRIRKEAYDVELMTQAGITAS
ncbi:MAG: glycerophosphoryl diester phosphodiesterase membrane domain-containing protein [Nocardioides sp.]